MMNSPNKNQESGKVFLFHFNIDLCGIPRVIKSLLTFCKIGIDHSIEEWGGKTQGFG